MRQAVAYAVNWPEILNGIFGDLAIPTTTALSSSNEYYLGEMFSYCLLYTSPGLQFHALQ